MRILLSDLYQGRVNKEIIHIEAGVYEIDDPALFGRGQYLVDNGHAVVIQEKPKPIEPKKVESKK